MASSVSARFMGQLPRIKLRLHDSLAIMVKGIRIINGAADHMPIISQTDALDPRGKFLCQHRFKKRGHQIIVNAEVAGTGIVYKLFAARA